MAQPNDDAALARALALSLQTKRNEDDYNNAVYQSELDYAARENKLDNDGQRQYDEDLARARAASTQDTLPTRQTVASEEKVAFGQLKAVETMNNMPPNGILIRYSGGDGMDNARALWNVALCRVPNTILTILTKQFQKPCRIPTEISKLLTGTYKQPIPQQGLDSTIVEKYKRDSNTQFSIPDFSGYTANLSFQISSQVYNDDPRMNNLAFHGWLFEEETKQPKLKGVTKYPLVGLFQPINIRINNPPSEVDWIGINTLRLADQHIHNRDEQGQWNIGSDMAKFCIEKTSEFSSAWCVCVDIQTRRCCIMYLLIVPGDAEPMVDSILRRTHWSTELIGWLNNNRNRSIANQIKEIFSVYGA